MKVVELHGGRPALNDIPGRLRLLADKIEAGDYGEVGSTLVLIPRHQDYPIILGYGNVEGDYQPIVQFTLAQHNFVANIMVRK